MRSVFLLFFGAISMGCRAENAGDARAKEVFQDKQVAALAIAACNGNSGVVSHLVRSGINPNSSGRDGITPLAWAIQCQNTPGVNQLLREGANPNHTIRGTNLVWVAAGYASVDIVKSLVDSGGDVGSTSPSGNSVLMHAMESGNWGVYDYILNSGIDLNLCEVGVARGSIGELAISAGELDRLADLVRRGYRCDLLGLAYGLENMNWNRDSQKKRDELQEMLRDLGVKWPLPTTLRSEDRRAYMAAHPEYAEKHPESGG